LGPPAFNVGDRNDPWQDAKELDNLLADADRALRQKLRAPVVISSKICGIESTEEEYIEQILRVVDTQASTDGESNRS
jgi:hypothetical protein